MNTTRVTQIFIGNGTSSLPANNTVISAAAVPGLGIFGSDMQALDPAGNDTISTAGGSVIQLFSKLANGDLKKSMRIAGVNVTGYRGQSYAAPTRKVHAIGYNRALSAGSIVVNNDTDYKFTIRFVNDKVMYSVRPEVLSVNFKSAVAASQSNIADQIVAGINNSAFGASTKKQIAAVKVGDGTGVYGLTGAANFGVEIWGLDVAQSTNQYLFNQVNFQVFLDDNIGFGSTASAQIQGADPGNGNYAQIFNEENKDLQYEGVLNRRLWPVPVQSYLASSSYIFSGAIVPTATTVQGDDKVVFSATVDTATTNILAGDKITLTGVQYEVKYTVGAPGAVTTAYLTVPYVAAGAAGVAVTKGFQYDLYNIEFTDLVTTPGANIGQFARKVVLIATPAINAGGATNSLSTEGTQIKAILNAWMTSTPLAPANLAL